MEKNDIEFFFEGIEGQLPELFLKGFEQIISPHGIAKFAKY